MLWAPVIDGHVIPADPRVPLPFPILSSLTQNGTPYPLKPSPCGTVGVQSSALSDADLLAGYTSNEATLFTRVRTSAHQPLHPYPA